MQQTPPPRTRRRPVDQLVGRVCTVRRLTSVLLPLRPTSSDPHSRPVTTRLPAQNTMVYRGTTAVMSEYYGNTMVTTLPRLSTRISYDYHDAAVRKLLCASHIVFLPVLGDTIRYKIFTLLSKACRRMGLSMIIPMIRVPACFTRDSVAIARICYGNSVCLSVCHTGGSVKNG